MNKSHAVRGHGLIRSNAGRHKPEVDKFPVSWRHKIIHPANVVFHRLDDGNFLASKFIPWPLCLWRLSVFVLPAAFACTTSVYAAPASQPVTVKDYFLRLPDKYFEITQAQRKDLIGNENPHSIVDLKHDYLYAGGDGAQPNLTVALFRYHGVVTVAVLDGGYDPNIPTLDFLRFRDEHWINVTRRILPLPFDNRLAYFLPRRGTIIRVRNSRGRGVYNLLWKQGRFFVGQPQ